MDGNNHGLNYLSNLNENTLDSEVKNLLQNMSPHTVKLELSRRGYNDEEVDFAIHKISKNSKSIRNGNANIILFKDFFDKIGYGFASPLLIYILLFTMGTPIIFIGIVAALRSLITLTTSAMNKEYNKKYNIGREKIATFGTLFGLSVLLIAFGKAVNSQILFSIGFLLSTVFVVIHGDFYSSYVINKLARARSHVTSKIVSYFGLIITAIAFMTAAYLLDFGTINLNLGFANFTVSGYLLVLEIVAFAFIFSSYAFSFVKPDIDIKRKLDINNRGKTPSFLNEYIKNIKINFSKFFSNKKIKTMFYGTLFSSSMQTLISTFSGIYIFSSLGESISNPFFYIAVIFGVGVVAASIAPSIARGMANIFGKTPMLIFSILLISIFPLSIYLGVSYYGLIISHAVAVVGASSLSIVQSFIIQNTLEETEKKTYFSAINSIMAIISPIIIILLSIIAYTYGLKNLFIIITAINILIVIPIYFSLVINAHKEHKSNMFS